MRVSTAAAAASRRAAKGKILLLAEDLVEHASERPAIFEGEASQLAPHETSFEGGEERLEDGGLEEPGFFPLCDGWFPDLVAGPDLTRDGEDDEIGPIAAVGLGADDDGGPLLAGGLIGKRKRHEQDISKLGVDLRLGHLSADSPSGSSQSWSP